MHKFVPAWQLVKRPSDAQRVIAALEALVGPSVVSGLLALGNLRVVDQRATHRLGKELMASVNAKELSFAYAQEVLITHLRMTGQYEVQLHASSQAFCRSADDQIVLVADRIEEGEEVAVYLHEVVHRHGRGQLGAKALGRLAGQVLGWSSWAEGQVERQIHDRALARANVSGEEGERYLEEVFAYAVEEAVKAGVKPRLKMRAGPRFESLLEPLHE
jgi:hypothetical protein